MSEEIEPVVGRWYRNREDGQEFEVVDVDPDESRIEIQFAGGEVDELDGDSWAELELESIEPPSGWDVAGEPLDPEDFGYSETGEEPERWNRRRGSGLDDDLGLHERDGGDF